MHVGDGAWVLVDSCGRTDAPTALEYLEILGVDPGEAVKLIVASHWHDDHIRGIAQMAAVCRKAKFCCSNVLCADEFLGVVHALDNRHFAASSSGVREIYSVFSRLREVGGVPTWAVANRRIFVHGLCRIWALSPSDDAFVDFMRAMSPLLPRAGQAETRVPSRSPNEIAVALRIEVGDIAVLLGADLEQRGWSKILEDEARPSGTASAFKVSHHGSESADESAVWEEMLEVDPIAILTPWRRGNRALPTNRDVRRILGRSSHAYATAKTGVVRPTRRGRAVERTIGESGIRLQRTPAPGVVRLRRPIALHTQWQVELLGPACHLREYLG